jgi:hypothetical protein
MEYICSGYLPDALNIKPKFNDIVRLHDVGFAFGADFAGRSGGGFRAGSY